MKWKNGDYGLGVRQKNEEEVDDEEDDNEDKKETDDDDDDDGVGNTRTRNWDGNTKRELTPYLSSNADVAASGIEWLMSRSFDSVLPLT